MKKCVFLDRDGVLNQDTEGYLFRTEDLIIPEGTVEALRQMKEAGYMLIVITNQAGIAKGLYKKEDVVKCHEFLQEKCGNLLDDLYFCPHHPDYTSNSLLRKPDSLMLEKAMAKYAIDPAQSWMIGDRERDVQAGHKAGVRTIRIAQEETPSKAEWLTSSLWEASSVVVA
ncbi:D-glycero-alpha-D-manno-heptose-1,7-bisphosphate 7-phosphatase [Siphonobacter aquaeclarae]|jgi:D-glycero-D-manno-heptose 1,7-bisphosphate phosphatase|uniref:D,D-heptose 1,7-bisphosphate phosphatase n=1 Tax=Siphonobacter aquaeclarae TaxID=563176 RepID=A0A1G9M679_9BACT|nr:HAD family hydrolase [Siphonobacter aquaeclarae]SDL69792.1 D-alpha,beta-D-heptose 1,7-bisphosphate phosphatase [Siphonobacter aquaeclarae]